MKPNSQGYSPRSNLRINIYPCLSPIPKDTDPFTGATSITSATTNGGNENEEFCVKPDDLPSPKSNYVVSPNTLPIHTIYSPRNHNHRNDENPIGDIDGLEGTPRTNDPDILGLLAAHGFPI